MSFLPLTNFQKGLLSSLSAPTGWPAARTAGPAARAASSPCWASVSLWPWWPCWCWASCPRSFWRRFSVVRAWRPSRSTWWVIVAHRDMPVKDKRVQPHRVVLACRRHCWKSWTRSLQHISCTPVVGSSLSHSSCSWWLVSLLGMTQLQMINCLKLLPNPHFQKHHCPV